MQEPRARVVGNKANRNVIVVRGTNGDDITSDWVFPIVFGTSSGSNDIEVVLFKSSIRSRSFPKTNDLHHADGTDAKSNWSMSEL